MSGLSARTCRRAGIAMGVALIVVATAAGCVTRQEQAAGKPYHHLADGRFRNPPGSPPETASAADMVAFLWRRLWDKPPELPVNHVLDQAAALAAFSAAAPADSVTWLGHAAFLLRLNETIVLTDPYLGRNAGPYGFGPERYVAPGLPLSALPPIDVLLVSHNHYDHLDAATIEALPHKERITVVVPLGLGAFFRERGYARVHELDWYERGEFAGVEVEVLPAVHFSRRGPFDHNRTLWSGFAIRTQDRRVFHSGDTGYGPVFAEIGRRAGPFDLALVAIGAYEPRSIMLPHHVTPEEAVRLVDDIRAERAIGMHWGTVILTDEPPFEAAERFRTAASRAAWAPGRASVMRIGETRTLDR